MDTYIGIKSVIAEPMKEFEYFEKIGSEVPISKLIKNREGYYVIFPTKQDDIYPDGVREWFPKEIFEEFFGVI
jgi:hypothetical protein